MSSTHLHANPSNLQEVVPTQSGYMQGGSGQPEPGASGACAGGDGSGSGGGGGGGGQVLGLAAGMLNDLFITHEHFAAAVIQPKMCHVDQACGPG